MALPSGRLVWFDPDLETRLRALGLCALCDLEGTLAEERVLALAETPAPITSARTRRLYRLPAAVEGAPDVYVKLQFARAEDLAPRKWASYTLQVSPLLREARAALALTRLGLRTPEILAAGARGRFPSTVRAVLITSEVPGTTDLESFLAATTGPAERRASIAAVEATVARVHELGFALGGARYRDFLVPREGARHADEVVILDAAAFGRGAKRRARDRSHLNLDRARFV